MSKVRGVYEKYPGSDIWWVRYTDSTGLLRRELAGTKSVEISLYHKRKNESLQGKKLPESLRRRIVPFSECCDDFAAHSLRNNAGHQSESYRIRALKNAFGEQAADSISIQQFRSWFDSQDWQPGTYNRCRTVLFSIYRLATENRKVASNPAKLLKRKKVSDERVRWLNQFPPLPTEIAYLKPMQDEESRLRAVIAHDWPEHMPEFDIAVNTGMRLSEQYLRVDWQHIDLARKQLFVPKSKNGDSRYIPLNKLACDAFQSLLQRRIGDGPIPIALKGAIFLGKGQERLLKPRHWFDDSVRKARIEPFSWHCLRHTFASRLVMQG